MALTSRSLYNALTSIHVKRELVINVMSSSNIVWDETERSLSASKPDKDLCLPKLKEDTSERRNAQSQLLGFKWLTSNFLMNCQHRFMQKNMEKILQCFFRSCSAKERDPAIERARSWAEELDTENCFLSEDTFNDFLCESPNEHSLERKDGAVSPIWLFKDHNNLICDFFLSQAGSCCFSHSVRRSWTLSMPRLSKDTRVPDCILKGPWTEERSLFLWHVHESLVRNALMDDLLLGHDDSDYELSNFNAEAASEGLLRALNERCVLAAVILAQPNRDPYLHKGYEAELGSYPPPFVLQAEVEQLSTRGFGVTIKACHMAAAYKWELDSDTKDFKIFSWLLHLAVAKDKKLTLYELTDWFCEDAESAWWQANRQHRTRVIDLYHAVSEDWSEFEVTWRYG